MSASSTAPSTTKMKWMGHLEFPATDVRGDQGIEEAIDGFVDRLYAIREAIPTSRIWPPN